MDTVRKIVETVTGDAGTDTLARQQERAGGSTRSDETSAAAAERERESRPPTQITTTTTERERRPVVEEPGSPPVETRRGLSGRSDTEAAERKTLEPSTTTTTTTTERREGGVLRTGETPLDLDKERQKREEEMIERETRARGEWSERTTGREGLERGRGEERGLYSSGRRSPEPYRRSGEYSPKHEEDKGFFERTKEFFTGGGGGGGRGLSMGGGFRDSEETRQLGLEKGQGQNNTQTARGAQRHACSSWSERADPLCMRSDAVPYEHPVSPSLPACAWPLASAFFFFLTFRSLCLF